MVKRLMEQTEQMDINAIDMATDRKDTVAFVSPPSEMLLLEFQVK